MRQAQTTHEGTRLTVCVVDAAHQYNHLKRQRFQFRVERRLALQRHLQPVFRRILQLLLLHGTEFALVDGWLWRVVGGDAMWQDRRTW